MALKIVHLCDVHSSKGEDVPAVAAHTMTADGVSFAIDLCHACDSERWAPLVAFVQAFALVIDDNAVAPTVDTSGVDLPRLLAQLGMVDPSVADHAAKAARKAAKADRKAARPTPAPEAPEAPTPALRAVQDPPAVVMVSGRNVAGLAKYHDRAHRQKRERVRERNQTPRVCPLDGTETTNPTQWHNHTTYAHGVTPAEMLGVVCPLCGLEFDRVQTLGMHGRREHDAVHTPQLFGFADAAGDPHGIVATIRARYTPEVVS